MRVRMRMQNNWNGGKHICVPLLYTVGGGECHYTIQNTYHRQLLNVCRSIVRMDVLSICERRLCRHLCQRYYCSGRYWSVFRRDEISPKTRHCCYYLSQWSRLTAKSKSRTLFRATAASPLSALCVDQLDGVQQCVRRKSIAQDIWSKYRNKLTVRAGHKHRTSTISCADSSHQARRCGYQRITITIIGGNRCSASGTTCRRTATRAF